MVLECLQLTSRPGSEGGTLPSFSPVHGKCFPSVSLRHRLRRLRRSPLLLPCPTRPSRRRRSLLGFPAAWRFSPIRREQLAFRSAFASWRRGPVCGGGGPMGGPPLLWPALACSASGFFCAPPIACEALLHVLQSQLDLARHAPSRARSALPRPFSWPGRSSSALSGNLPWS